MLRPSLFPAFGLCALVLAVAAVACSGGGEESPESEAQNTPRPTVSAATASTTPEPTPAPIETAEDIVVALRTAGLPIPDYVVYTAETDPNDLLGRPGGYLSKVNFRDGRVEEDYDATTIDVSEGGSVEVFDDEDGAQRRYEYLKDIAESVAFLSEYDYLRGKTVLRLAKALTPDEATGYEDALKGLGE